MLIHLFKDIMCCSVLGFFDKASIHTRDMLKNTIFSLNKENYFPHYHACSVSKKINHQMLASKFYVLNCQFGSEFNSAPFLSLL